MNDFKRGKYLVGGLGITGASVIDFLLRQGCSLVGFEELSLENYEALKKKTDAEKALFYFKSLPDKVFKNCEGVIVSPGVPLTRPWIQEAQKRNIPVTGELELASRFIQGSIIAVTGTNGKSTTVTLLNAILKTGGFTASLKGNIGSPLITALAEPPAGYYVVEVSSYQLETIESFHPKVSINLNVTSDHLERYAGIHDYAKAKARIFMNQQGEDAFIFNADDPFCRTMARRAKCKTYPFSLVNHFSEGGFVNRDEMVVRINEKESRYSLKDCSLSGLHNQENMLASLIAATLMGVDRDAISETLKSFKPLSHRVEYVGEWGGISFYDDSKGTNVGAVVMSLASFEKDVILILGGRDKGGDYSPLKSLIQVKVKALVILGEAREKISAVLEGLKPLYQVSNMEEAVSTSFKLGKPGDVVLLSPACSSFDQYKNYAERGKDFQQWVSCYGKKSR